MKPLLIGQAPGPNTDPDLPLFPVPATSAGGRLCQMTGLLRGEYLLQFDRINVLNFFPGQVRRDDKFPMSPARFAASTMKPFLAGRVVVLVGRNVANAFGHTAEFHEWGDMQCRRDHHKNPGGCQIAIIPHPSGRNHWYNDAANKIKSQNFWREFINNLP